MNHRRVNPADLRLTPIPGELYLRHLGVPSESELDEPAASLAENAGKWSRENGHPWTCSRLAALQGIEEDTLLLDDGTLLTSRVLAEGARRSGTHSLSILAVSAGAEVEEEIVRLWAEEKPDEAMFLNSYAAAFTEHLRALEEEKTLAEFSAEDMTVLPYYSPGYDGWALSDQAALAGTISDSLPGPLEVLPSGGLKPAKSALAVFAVACTTLPEVPGDYWQEIYVELSGENRPSCGESSSYSFSKKALDGWREKRLEVLGEGDELQAIFRFDGSTCTNLGLPLLFEYRINLCRQGENDYRLLEFSCEPHPDDTGHTGMCSYLQDPEAIMEKIRVPPALPGSSLAKVLEWSPQVSPAGCLCAQSSRDHKWRIVLQTLHYSLLNESRGTP